MPNLELEEEEADLIRDLLEREVDDVRDEIQRTTDAHYRAELEEEEKLLLGLLKKV